MVLIFISKTSDILNKKKTDIEKFTNNICLNPLYSSNVTLTKQCNIMMDSGAFQERNNRVNVLQAYNRQNSFEKKLNQNANYIVAYDKIDNAIVTMENNKYLLNLDISNKKVCLVQGDDIEWYKICLKSLLKLSNEYDFVLGFGGIAKIANNSYIKDKLYTSISETKEEFINIKHIHLFGVLNEFIINDIQKIFPDKLISVDTAGIEIKSVMGMEFIKGRWIKRYNKLDKYINYHPTDLLHINLINVLEYYKDV